MLSNQMGHLMPITYLIPTSHYNFIAYLPTRLLKCITSLPTYLPIHPPITYLNALPTYLFTHL
jgi:hypothetical protein